MFKQFGDFIKRGNVLDLAVGVIIGAAFADIVKSVTDNLIGPVIGIIIGELDLTHSLILRIGKQSLLKFGSVLQSVISFLITAFVVFLIVKVYHKITNKEIGKPAVSGTDKLLTEIRDLLKERKTE